MSWSDVPGVAMILNLVNGMLGYRHPATGLSIPIGSGLLPVHPVAGGGTYVMKVTDGAILADCTVAETTAQLPASSACFSDGVGRVMLLKKMDATIHAAIFQTAGLDHIDGLPSFSLTDEGAVIVIVATGTGWAVIYRA